MSATKAGAERWLGSHLGCAIGTVQSLANGRTWTPGPRTLSKRSARDWTLDGSSLTLTPNHTVIHIDDDNLTVQWSEDDGTMIHITTYSVIR